MLMQIGSVTFDVIGFNTHEYSTSSETSFARIPVLGTRDVLEHTGEVETRLVVTGKILPLRLGGLGQLAEVQQMRQSGLPQLVLRGDGHVYGWYLIETIDENSGELHRSGIGQEVDFTITMCRAEKPTAQDFTTSIFSILE